jgi:hypothetical protein
MSRKAWLWIVQGALAVIVLLFLARALARHWSELRSLEIEITWHPAFLAGAAGAIFLTYALHVASWRRILAGWGQSIGYGTAARVWCLSNLARYVPGRVWSIAGLVVLAQRAGVAAWAAAGSTVAVQAVGLGTAVVLVALTAPGAAGSPFALLLAATVAAGALGLLVSSFAASRVNHLLPSVPWKALAPQRALESVVLTFAAWASYGLAFWLLARGIGVNGLSWSAAASVFALGYIVGLVALFAPGGIGVREAAFVALLTPLIGAGAAVALSVASRVLLTLTEAAAAMAALLAEKSLRGGQER